MGDKASAATETTEVVIIGAGPAGLWAAFQLSLHEIPFVLIEASQKPGGQCAHLYDDKPIYDLPGTPAIEAGNLVVTLLRQLEPFSTAIRLGVQANSIKPHEHGLIVEITDGGALSAANVMLATGLGPFRTGVEPRNLQLPNILQPTEKLIEVSAATFESACNGLFMVGDAASYPGKLPLLVCAFHEAALAAFAIKQKRAGGKRLAQEFSSTSSRMRAFFPDS